MLTRRAKVAAGAILLLLAWPVITGAGALFVPNSSFESPLAPRESPYAGPDMDGWQKSAQPPWYDPAQNFGTPWAYLMGQFYNAPGLETFIDNCEGSQAAFLFAVPEVALFQDYDTVSGTNTVPDHAFNATYQVGASYDLAVGVMGGGGGMSPGATLELSLYYRDVTGNQVAVASTTVTNTADLFPTNTHLVDFKVQVPPVKATDPWAGRHIGIQLLSTVGFSLAAGYWDLDNARLTEAFPPPVTINNPVRTGTQFSFNIASEPGARFEIQATTSSPADALAWTSLGSVTNANGTVGFTDNAAGFGQRYYRLRRM